MEAGLTIEQVAEKLDLSPSTVSRMETAQAGVRRPDVRELLDLYQAAGTERQELLQLLEQSRKPPWWQEYKDLPMRGPPTLKPKPRSYASTRPCERRVFSD